MLNKGSLFVCIMVYKSLNDSMPNHICDTLTSMRDCHNHDTRNELLLFHTLVLVMVNELLLMLGSVYGITCLMFLNHLVISAHLGKLFIVMTTVIRNGYYVHSILIIVFYI